MRRRVFIAALGRVAAGCDTVRARRRSQLPPAIRRAQARRDAGDCGPFRDPATALRWAKPCIALRKARCAAGSRQQGLSLLLKAISGATQRTKSRWTNSCSNSRSHVSAARAAGTTPRAKQHHPISLFRFVRLRSNRAGHHIRQRFPKLFGILWAFNKPGAEKSFWRHPLHFCPDALLQLCHGRRLDRLHIRQSHELPSLKRGTIDFNGDFHVQTFQADWAGIANIDASLGGLSNLGERRIATKAARRQREQG